jgi:3-dehydroquinate synthase
MKENRALAIDVPHMPPIQQAVEVRFRYPVHFTTHVFASDNVLFRDTIGADDEGMPKKLICVLDQGVVDHHPGLPDQIESYCREHQAALALAGRPLLVAGGEQVKNDPAAVIAIQRAIHEHKIDRHAYVVAVGGGAVIDMVGYAAAIAHRGVRLVRVPTTVLSQNDSAVGVKNSVNAFGKKNFLGTFAPPYAVLNDFAFLPTLSARDWRSGISEAIKVALLKDPAFFEFIERRADDLARRDMTAMQWLIYRCAQLHLDHIANSGDPFELGSSRPLDFGHWAAHKLEQLSRYTLRHGEAVAIGIALDATYARLAGLLPERDWQRILRVIDVLGMAIYAPELEQHLSNRADPRCVLSGLDEFREHLGGRLTIMLLQGIGRGIEVHAIDHARMIASIELLKQIHDDQAQRQGGHHEQPLRHMPAHAAAAD